MDLETEYNHRCNTQSDIQEHLPTLRHYASECRHITEMGVRSGNSTVALACGRPKYMISYDINQMSYDLVDLLQSEIPFHFLQRDVLQISIESTDLLFIDTLHTFHQLSQELIRHAPAAQKYIIMHDTVTFGLHGEDGRTPGLLQAIEDCLLPERWRKIRNDKNNNGLIVMERIPV